MLHYTTSTQERHATPQWRTPQQRQASTMPMQCRLHCEVLSAHKDGGWDPIRGHAAESADQAPVSRPNRGAPSSGPPAASAEMESGPTAGQRPNSDTVWYASEEARRMSSTAPVETCARKTGSLAEILVVCKEASATAPSKVGVITVWQSGKSSARHH